MQSLVSCDDQFKIYDKLQLWWTIGFYVSLGLSIILDCYILAKPDFQLTYKILIWALSMWLTVNSKSIEISSRRKRDEILTKKRKIQSLFDFSKLSEKDNVKLISENYKNIYAKEDPLKTFNDSCKIIEKLNESSIAPIVKAIVKENK